MSRETKQISLSVPFFNGNEWKYVKKCLDTVWVSGSGEFVKEFEDRICKYTGAKYAIACINGTAGLQVALRLCDVNMEDEVIVPTLTFIAPINSIKYLSAEPIFMDCDEYLNLDAEKLNDFCSKECRVTKYGLRNKKTNKIIKAVIPVHIFGNPCDMEKIMFIAEKFKLKVVEDAAESIGSYYANGKYKNKFTGTIGDFGIYSFNGNKIITTGGGGVIVTNNYTLAKKARYFVNQAKDDSIRYIHKEIGYNFRLSNLQAALGCAQMEQINNFIEIKRSNYQIYKKHIDQIDGLSLIDEPDYAFSIFWLYSLVVDKKKYGLNRDDILNKLLANRIESRPLWYLNHLQRPYKNCQIYKIEKALEFSKKILNIPSSVTLTEKDINRVAGILKK